MNQMNNKILYGEYIHKYIADTTTLYDRHKELYDTGEKIQLIP